MRLRLRILVISLFLVIGLAPPAKASDQRVIDIAELTWAGAPKPSVSAETVRSSLELVRQNWISFTSLQGASTDKSIEFVYGRTATAISLTAKFDCDGTNFNSFSNSIRQAVYKQLGIAEYKDRYLTILVPNAGCIWMGRALLGDVKVKGGTLVLHNNASPFVITHELGHSLGLGHSNFLRCSSGKGDGAWSNDCKAVEYGGSIDVMGNVDTPSPLSVYHQWRMGLLEDSEIYQSWLNEKITLSASDVKAGTRAVFLRDGKSSYWLEYRRARAGVGYKPGIVIYRTDPPPSNFIESPNPLDSVQENPGQGISSDIWMLNLDNYTYSSTGRTAGSMSLSEAKSFSLYSNNITISFSAGKDANSVELNISRKVDTTPPPSPSYSQAAFWQFPDFPVLQNGYEDSESVIAYYEIKRDEEISKLAPEIEKDFPRTYLAPLNPSPTLRIKDLPEGKYELQVRAVDVWGNISNWSPSRSVFIDRGAPTLSSGYRITQIGERVSTIALSELKDPGSGLCETVLINPEGVVVARSSAKASPEFELNTRVLSASKIQTFDCLGNGRQANFAANYQFIEHQEIRKVGKWRTVSGNPRATQCLGKCVAYFNTDGAIQVALGSGSATIGVGRKVQTRVSPSSSPALRLSDPVAVGNNVRAIRIEGSNFTLYGIAKASLQLSGVVNLNRIAHPEDLSLQEAKQVMLSNLGFNSSDFEQGWFVLPMSGGTTLNDPTLDFCDSKYVSDEKRLERRQVVASKVGNPYLFLSSEVVRYQSQSGAKAAYEELIDKAKKCLSDGGGFESSGTFAKYRFIPLADPALPYQILPNSFVVHSIIGEAGNARTLLAFYQFDGEMFTGLYVVTLGENPLKSSEIARWSDTAKIFADRLKNFNKN